MVLKENVDRHSKMVIRHLVQSGFSFQMCTLPAGCIGNYLCYTMYIEILILKI